MDAGASSPTLMVLDSPLSQKRTRDESPDLADDEEAAALASRKKPAKEASVKALPVVITTEMMIDKSPSRPATPGPGRPRSNAVWTHAHLANDCNKVIMAGL